MTNVEAIETLIANYPDACYEQLREAVDAAIEALKAQDAAGDTINRQAAIDIVWEWFKKNGINGDRCLDGLRQLSSAQPERKTGKWLRVTDGHYEYFRCSQCGKHSDEPKPFCRCCEAKMEEGDTL